MNDMQLKTLMVLNKEGSFGKTADKMFLSKQAVKKQMDTLEEELGFAILNRSSHGISLTQAGEEFSRYASKALKSLTEGISKSRSIALHSQTIRIENPTYPRVFLQDAICAFSEKYPEVHIEVAMDDNTDGIEHVREGLVDIAEHVITPDMDIPAGISHTVVARLSYACFVAPNHPLAKKETIDPEDLSDYTVGISRIAKNREIYNLLCRSCGHLDIREYPDNEVQDIFTICLNQGVYLTKAYFATSLEPLLRIPLNTEIGKDCAIFYRSDPSPAVQAFVNLVKEIYC